MNIEDVPRQLCAHSSNDDFHPTLVSDPPHSFFSDTSIQSEKLIQKISNARRGFYKNIHK